MKIRPVFLVVFITFIAVFTIVSSCRIDLYQWQGLEKLSYIVPEIERFRYRVLITVDNSLYNEDFTDFPVLVKLDGSGDVQLSLLDSTAPLIRFYSEDLQQELAFEVEQWDPSGAGECYIWVKVPEILASSDPGARFYLYYDYDSELALSSHSTYVWSDNFNGVWHFNETTGTCYRDSSPGGHCGGLTGNTQTFTAPTPTAGPIAGAQQWVNGTDGIAIPPISTSDLGPFTISLWTYIDDLGSSNNGRFFDKGWADEYGFHARVVNDDIYFEVAADTLVFGDNRVLTINNVVNAGAWNWWCFRYDGDFVNSTATERANYKNAGSMEGSTGGDGTGNSGYDGDSGAYLHIGNSNFDNNLSIRGRIDEVRISSVMRTETWIQAQYASMTDSYLDFGPEEEMEY